MFEREAENLKLISGWHFALHEILMYRDWTVVTYKSCNPHVLTSQTQ
jgi:hypothetical protein